MATKKQDTGLSCGAACLLVAGEELGVTAFTIPAQARGNGVTIPEKTLTYATDARVDMERVIYRITGQGRDGYSMPADIGKCANYMGLTSTVHMAGCIMPSALQWLYPAAASDCEDVGMTVERSGAGELSQNQRQLCVVCILGMLHWVLYRPAGTYMDPASGEDFSYFVTMGQGPGYLLKYFDTGISVVVTKP